MAYSFNKLSFLFGGLLIALLVAQTVYAPMKYELQSDAVEKQIKETVDTKICEKQDMPEIYTQLTKMVPQFNVQIAVMATLGYRGVVGLWVLFACSLSGCIYGGRGESME